MGFAIGLLIYVERLIYGFNIIGFSITFGVCYIEMKSAKAKGVVQGKGGTVLKI